MHKTIFIGCLVLAGSTAYAKKPSILATTDCGPPMTHFSGDTLASADETASQLALTFRHDECEMLAGLEGKNSEQTTALRNFWRLRAKFYSDVYYEDMRRSIALLLTKHAALVNKTAQNGDGSSATDSAQQCNSSLPVPGWENVCVGRAPPSDVRMHCKPSNAGNGFEECEVCRPTDTITSCANVAVHENNVSMITFDLGKYPMARIRKYLQGLWGPAVRVTLPDEKIQGACWKRDSSSVLLLDTLSMTKAGTHALVLMDRDQCVGGEGWTDTPSGRKSNAPATSFKPPRTPSQQTAKANCDEMPNPFAIVAGLGIGNDYSTFTGCTTDQPIAGQVVNTTKDGWMVVVAGESIMLAIRARQLRADGSQYMHSGFKYLGLKSFNLVGGGNRTVAAFVETN